MIDEKELKQKGPEWDKHNNWWYLGFFYKHWVYDITYFDYPCCSQIFEARREALQELEKKERASR